jgi:hypothetical protein
VTALAGNEAELWVGTLNDGLLWWHGGQTERIGEEQGLPDRRVEQIALGDGRAYVGTPMGVAEVREGKVAPRAGAREDTRMRLLADRGLAAGGPDGRRAFARLAFRGAERCQPPEGRLLRGSRMPNLRMQPDSARNDGRCDGGAVSGCRRQPLCAGQRRAAAPGTGWSNGEGFWAAAVRN